MGGSFEGKVVLVTGGNSGIGRTAVLAFAQEGARVVLTGRRQKEGVETVEAVKKAGGFAEFVAADFSKAEEVEGVIRHVVKTYGRLDVAFNNAGSEKGFGQLSDLNEADFDQSIAINLKAVWLAVKHEVGAMLKTGGGTIVNNASVVGLIGVPGASVYSAAKAGVIGLTRAAAIEVAKSGIRINAIAAGMIETEMLGRVFGQPDTIKQFASNFHAMGRAGKTEEIAGTVLWLASDKSSFVTGQVIAVDGGASAQ